MSVGYKAKLDALMKEFPFISRYIGDKGLAELPKISRVDLDVIDGVGYTEKWFWNCYDLMATIQLPISIDYFLLTKEGKQLAKVRPCDMGATPRKKLWGIFSRKPKKTVLEGETVHNTVKKLDNPDEINFVVWVATGFIPRTTKIIVHKVPAGIPFSVWISSIKEIAENELAREISKIDTVE